MIVTRRFTFALAFFVLSFAVYNLNGRCIPTHDTLPARLLPVALLTSGTLTLDQFGPSMSSTPGVDYFYTRTRNGHLVSIYPVVVPLVATPFFVPAAIAMRRGDAPQRTALLLDMSEKISASAIAAMSVAIVWLLLSRSATPWTAATLTIAYAFATETWMIGSQALWQHGLSELLLAGLLLALRSSSALAFGAAGALSALLVANRPTNVFFAVTAGILCLRASRRGAVAFGAGAAPVLALVLAYNLATFASPLGGYGTVNAASRFTLGLIPSGVAGLLVSPGRGLLSFAPFLVCLVGLISRRARASLPAPSPWMLVAAAVQLVFFASWFDWTGGECYGPRFLTDMTPVLTLGLVPIVERFQQRSARIIFALAVLYGIAVQAIGAFCYQMGGSGTPRDQWSLANVQYLIELRAGPAPPSFGAWLDAISLDQTKN